MSDEFIIAGRRFGSRLLLGTGKFSSAEVLRGAIMAAGSEIVTVALRRVDLENPDDDLLRAIDSERVLFLPNTSGARTADEAIRLAQMAAALGGTKWVKLEVIPDQKYLLPDPIETLKAAEALVKDGFVVLPYINADLVLAKRLEEVGTATVMPLAAPIGSNQGLRCKDQIQMIIDSLSVPVIVDAGLGTPSQAAEAMEMGADAVLVNTAIATAERPGDYAEAFKWGVRAGRQAFLSGIPGRKPHAEASSPLTGFLQT